MYRIYNKSLDNLLQSRNIKDLYELPEDDLYELCEEIHFSPATEGVKSSRKTKAGNEIGSFNYRNNRIRTIDAILNHYSVSIMMGSPYWEQRHYKKAEEWQLETQLFAAEHGSQTYKLFEKLGIGVEKLEPGKSIDLDLTRRFVNEVLRKPPYFPVETSGLISDLITIEDLESGDKQPKVQNTQAETLKQELTAEPKEKTADVYDSMSRQELLNIAKLRNKKLPENEKVRLFGIKDIDLLEFLRKTAK